MFTIEDAPSWWLRGALWGFIVATIIWNIIYPWWKGRK
jgi:hypothetical protein